MFNIINELNETIVNVRNAGTILVWSKSIKKVRLSKRSILIEPCNFQPHETHSRIFIIYRQ